MTFFSEMAETASELLSEFGQPAVFTYYSGAVYDPVLMTETTGTLETITGNGYPTNYNQNEVSDTIISSDIKLLCEKVSVKPQPNWECTLGGIKYRVMNSQAIGLTDDAVIYYVQLRK